MVVFLNRKIKFNFASCIGFIQVVLIWFYLFGNIEDRSEGGVRLSYLVIYFLFGALIVFFGKWPRLPSIKKTSLIFLCFALWVSLRHLVDKSGVDDLKQVTIGTTGGIILFYIMGAVLRKSIEILGYAINKFFIGFAFIYTTFAAWLLFDFNDKVRLDIFLLNDVNGDYQRPGNFMSIGYLILSYLYAFSAISRKAAGVGFAIAFCVLYSLDTFFLLACSQLLGSNSATVVIAGGYILTLIFIISVNKQLVIDFYCGELKYSLLWKYFNIGIKNFCILIGVFLFAAMIFFLGSDFDLMKLRVLNFSEDGDGSLNSRVDIFVRWGLEQMSYAPILGNVDVAYHVTGDSGTALHNFLPNILASLGLVGLLMVAVLLYCVFSQHYRLIVKNFKDQTPSIFIGKSISIYSLAVLIYIFFIANISVGFSWAVFWFIVGFLGSLLEINQNQEIDSMRKFTHE